MEIIEQNKNEIQTQQNYEAPVIEVVEIVVKGFSDELPSQTDGNPTN